LLQAIERGHNVKALVRDPSKLDVSFANLEVVQGDVLDQIQVSSCSRVKMPRSWRSAASRGKKSDRAPPEPETS
jgi:NAD(P)H-binding